MEMDPRVMKRFTEDLQLVPEPGGPRDYADSCSGPVQYVAVAIDSGIIGYLWAADADDAASFVPRPAAGGDTYNGWVAWDAELRKAKGRNIPPTQALSELMRGVGNDAMGYVVPRSEAEAPSLGALKELAEE